MARIDTRRQAIIRPESSDDTRAFQRVIEVARQDIRPYERPLPEVLGRRKFVQTAGALFAVSFVPVSIQGCENEDVGRILFALLDVIRQVFVSDEDVEGRMQVDNQTGAPLNIEVLLDLIEGETGSAVDQVTSGVMNIPINMSPVYMYGGLRGENTGSHEVLADASSTQRRTSPFQIVAP